MLSAIGIVCGIVGLSAFLVAIDLYEGWRTGVVIRSQGDVESPCVGCDAVDCTGCPYRDDWTHPNDLATRATGEDHCYAEVERAWKDSYQLN